MTLNERLIELRNFLDVVGVLLWIPISIFGAILLILVPRLRRRKNWIGVVAAGTALSALPFHHDALLKGLAEFYTYRLDSLRVLDGIAFPVDSTVRLSMVPPHHVMGGNVPMPMKVLGVTVIGEFETSPPTASEPSLVREGILPAKTDIRGVPCAPGRFFNTGRGYGDWLASIKGEESFSSDIRPYHELPNTVRCTLAADMPVAGAILRAGVEPQIRLTNVPHEFEFYGELAVDAVLREIACAPGRVSYRPFTIECILARDQTLFGIPLAAQHQVTVIQYPYLDTLDDIQRFSGTLSQAGKVVGFELPGGTGITVFLRKEANTAWAPDSVNFVLQKDVELGLQGAVLHGPLLVTSNYNRLLEVQPAYPDPGFISFAGRRHCRLKHWSGTNWIAQFEGGQWTFRDTLGETFAGADIDEDGRTLIVPVNEAENQDPQCSPAAPR